MLAGVLVLMGLWSTRWMGGAGGRALADEPAVRQRVATGRFCTPAPGTSGEVPPARPAGGNASTRADTGAIIVVFAAALPDTILKDDRESNAPSGIDHFDPMNVVRYRNAQAPGWRSRTGIFPQQVGYELRGMAVVERVAFRHTRATPPETWAREVSLLLSTEGPDSGFYNVGRWTLAQTADAQEFLFFETPARYVRVCFYSNYGSSESISLGNFALGVWTSDLPAASAPLLPPAAAAGGAGR